VPVYLIDANDTLSHEIVAALMKKNECKQFNKITKFQNHENHSESFDIFTVDDHVSVEYMYILSALFECSLGTKNTKYNLSTQNYNLQVRQLKIFFICKYVLHEY
jgi:hypothetical protein